MNILVCFKVSPDTDNLTAKEAAAIRDGVFDPRFVRHSFGAGDEAALENALRLRGALAAGAGGQAARHRLTAATAGECQSRFFTELYAVNYDRVVHIPLEGAAHFAPGGVAAALARFVQAQGGFDLILTGGQAGPGESAMVPGLLAAALDLPCVTNVYDFAVSPAPADSTGLPRLTALARGPGEELELTLAGPAVCALSDAAFPCLRLSKLRDRMAAAKRAAEVWAPPPEAAGGLRAQALTAGDSLPARYLYEERTGRCRFLSGDSSAEKAQALCHLLTDGEGGA